ncbi:DUF4976 domain-containing protein [Candidatus Nomurabacteria bacterium]|nr:DUF4976 domain-containing protein [Candidatus Nomurabacteria bacterium]
MDNPGKTKQIVLIMTDTQRWDMVSCYSNKGLKTPCIDKLAESGIRFDRAYTTQPVCGPARSAIFTGLYPHSNGVYANSMPLGDNVHTIGQRLRDNGLHTAYIGKWHLDGGDYFGLGKAPDGWDPEYWYDMRNYLYELSDEDRLRSRQTSIMNNEDIPRGFTYASRCTERAEKFLNEHSSEDFFLVVSYDEPHHPFLCPQPYASMYKDYDFPADENTKDSLVNKPLHQRAWAGSAINEDRENYHIRFPYYFGCNSFVDSEIGRVLDKVNELAPDALVIYTSDHGDFLGSHRLSGKGPAAYDEICRIPLIIRWPGVSACNTVSTKPASHIDIVPTIFDAAGIDIPQWIDGTSIRDAISDPDNSSDKEIYIEFTRFEIDHDGFDGFQPIRAVFDGRYKLVINLLDTDELYDLANDPGELVNIINDPDHDDIRNELHGKIIRKMNSTRDPFRGYQWERRPWRKDAPAASWNVSGMTRQRENEEYEPRQLDYTTGLSMKEAVRSKD